MRKAGPRWLLIGPVWMFLFALLALATSEKSGVTMAMFWLALLGSLLVGFCEEMATRGALIIGLRGRLTEPWVLFYSTLLFALLHLPNWLFGGWTGGDSAGVAGLWRWITSLLDPPFDRLIDLRDGPARDLGLLEFPGHHLVQPPQVGVPTAEVVAS